MKGVIRARCKDGFTVLFPTIGDGSRILEDPFLLTLLRNQVEEARREHPLWSDWEWVG